MEVLGKVLCKLYVFDPGSLYNGTKSILCTWTNSHRRNTANLLRKIEFESEKREYAVRERREYYTDLRAWWVLGSEPGCRIFS